MVHYRNSLKNNIHPKFYSCVKKYKWSKFGFLVVELDKNKTILREKENIWLNKMFNDFALRDNILNLLKLGNNRLNYKHSEKTTNLISELMKGKRKSEIQKLNISKGLIEG